ncbi:hypothetical protein APHCR_1499 [Anaplasma phagocytophilum str. CR1007]|nr:hypothetical protein APHCR_1499 [Anaplasma phagocytophilum str. CR1007]
MAFNPGLLLFDLLRFKLELHGKAQYFAEWNSISIKYRVVLLRL